MIDTFKRIARIIKCLRLPAMVLGVVSFGSLVVIIFTSNSREGDFLLIPSIVGLLWGMSAYSFIVTFQSVPEKTGKTIKFFSRFKRNVYRGWYWIVGIAFLFTTVGLVLTTFRVASIWIRDYYG